MSTALLFERMLTQGNQIEAALRDYLQANNALDLQFSNKIYAPKYVFINCNCNILNRNMLGGTST